MDLSLTLDDNAKDVLTTLIQTGIGAAVAVVVAIAGFWHARRLDEARSQREDRVRADQATRDDAEKRRLAQRAAGAAFIGAAAAARMTAHTAERAARPIAINARTQIVQGVAEKGAALYIELEDAREATNDVVFALDALLAAPGDKDADRSYGAGMKAITAALGVRHDD